MKPFHAHTQIKKERMRLNSDSVKYLTDLPWDVRKLAMEEFKDEQFRREIDAAKEKMRDPKFWKPKWNRWFNITRWRLVCR